MLRKFLTAPAILQASRNTVMLVLIGLTPLRSFGANFDFQAWAKPAEGKCEDFFVDSGRLRKNIEQGLLIEEGRLYKEQTLYIVNDVLADIEHQIPRGGESYESLYHRHSQRDLYLAGLFIEPMAGRVVVRQDHTNKARWAPMIIWQHFMEKYNQRFPKWAQLLGGGWDQQSLQEMAKMMKGFEQPANRADMENKLFGKYPLMDAFSYALMWLSNPEVNGFAKELSSKLSTGPHEADLRGKVVEVAEGSMHSQHITLREPVSEIRFTSDQTLQIDNSVRNGYLSIIGWSQVRYYRLQDEVLTPISVKTFEAAVPQKWKERGFISPEVDIRPDRLGGDFEIRETTYRFRFSVPGYIEQDWDTDCETMMKLVNITDYDCSSWEGRVKEWKRFNVVARDIRQTMQVPVQNDNRDHWDFYLLAQMSEHPPAAGWIHRALGLFAESLVTADLDDEVIELPLFPRPFYRLAFAAMTSNSSVYEQMLTYINNWLALQNPRLSIRRPTEAEINSDTKGRSEASFPAFVIVDAGQRGVRGSKHKWLIRVNHHVRLPEQGHPDYNKETPQHLVTARRL